MRKLKRSGLVLLTLFFVLAMVFWVLIYTPFGLKMALSLLHRYVPELSIQQAQGSLHRLKASSISYRRPGIDITVNELQFVLSGRCLLGAKLCLDDLQVNGVNGQIDSSRFATTPPDPDAKPLTEITTPRPIQLRGAHLNAIRFNIDGTEFEIGDLFTGLVWAGGKCFFIQANSIILN